MKRREISETEVANVLAKPEQTEMIREGRAVYQAHIKYGAPSKEYLLRGLLILKTPHQVL